MSSPAYKKIDLDKVIIYDIETLVNCIIICCRDFKTGSKKEFIIYNNPAYSDQPLAFYKFLRNCVRHGYSFMGFNNVNFDSQVIDYFYNWCCELQDPLYNFESDYIIDQLYAKAQEIINLPREDAFKHLIQEADLFIPQIDVFKQLHYERKKTSLKWVQFSMQYPNIEEMPIPHDEPITIDQIPEVVSYCWNDVDSTYTFFTKVKYETDVRLSMAKEYKVDIVNASEPRMVREIFATFITKQMGITYQELKKLRTVRKYVAFKDIIFPYVDFKTKQLQDVLALFKETAVNTSPTYKPPVRIKGQPKPVDESKFEHVFDFHGMDVVLGLGGIHACAGPGVYTHEEDEVIEDADGTSFYPMLAIKNGLRPEHLGESFNTVYPMMFEERKKYGKKDPRNYIFKIILNSAYGLSKEINGYLYDPKFTYAITINGQLSLLMLAEALSMSVPDIKFIQMNTDGLTYKYKKVHEPIVRKICQWWEKTTKIDLEYAYYSKMVFRDVNNYMAVDTQGGVKKKGIFETAVPYHKDPSSLIIRKALEEYFINDLTPEQYISRPEHSIFDFCNGVKKTHDFKLNLVRYLGASKDPTFTSQQEIKDFLAEHGWHEQFVADNWVHGDNNHGMAGMPMRSALESAIKHSRTERGAVEMVEEQQKVTRYIISTATENSGTLYKDFKDGRRINVEAGKLVVPLNKINPEHLQANMYPIDYADYCRETRRIIDTITPPTTQQTLF